ncbi:efflux transporter, RND family, MFP subunit [Caldithrix abyssi DSM 13497]|uniref:Efflux transporter, RND family, MFP subunit n=1 Tax=Caldithrix abyssi DSM 13497 TaxID=880073 RepID=H1XX83_CALAY|nr:efflux RND transporter periplasmic adaptor subunit [Caldithrix abyssi]APF20679.1 RND family efflux transporter, MFP subunit [Caldithrix abyssi DSM 13497]EHO40820.1 efflux transporter, RND family, MFP subunit [Caldithrix abyssi DSM 13497]
MKRSITLILLLGLSLLILAACGRQGNKDRINAQNQRNDSSARAGVNMNDPAKNVERVPVEVMPVLRGDIAKYLLISSNLETEVMADVYSRIQGIVEKIYKEEGQYVEKGEVMLELEAREYELSEQKARVEYEQQKRNFDRLKAMFEKNLLSQEEFEKARYALEATEIAWKQAKLQLDFTKVRSPITGRVGQRLTKIGERIQPTDKLFSVVDNSQVIAVVYVPEKNMREVKIGQRAYITSDHFAGQRFEGWVKRLSPVVDPSSGTFKVTVGVRNRSSILRPGMFVNVHIILDTHKDVVLVPKTAIVYENENMYAYVVRDSIAHRVKIQPGYEDNEKVEVLKDIEEGEMIIVVGQAGMKDQTPVRIVNVRENVLVSKH